MRPLLRPFVLATTLTILAGCARVTVNTEMSANGSFKRTVKYSISSAGMTGNTITPPATPEGLFRIPQQSSSVLVVPGTDSDAKFVTVTSSVAAGTGQVNDIEVLDPKTKAPAITSSVTVTKLADGNLEYIETLHAIRHFSLDLSKPNGQVRGLVKSALPARYQTTATIDKITSATVSAFMHVVMGPPEPIIAEAIVDPDLMTHKAKSLAQKSFHDLLKENLPDISESELQAAIIKYKGDPNFSKSVSSQPGTPDSNSDPNELMPLTFTTSYPGKIVKTNGIVDEDSGEVYWSLLAPTLEFGDVKLRLVVDPTVK